MSEIDLLQEGLARLEALTGSSLQLQPLTRGRPEGWPVPGSGAQIDGTALMSISVPNGMSGELLIEARQNVTPEYVRTQLVERAALYAQFGGGMGQVLLIAPWLSPRARRELTQIQINYLDLTGNVSIRLPQPLVIIQSQGADSDPRRDPTVGAQLSGDRAGRLVRFLADVRPPYRAQQIAERTGLSSGYVSKLLAALERRELIVRQRRVIVEVDWAALLQERAEQSALLKVNRWQGWFAPNTIQHVLDKLSHLPQEALPSVTGTYGVRDFAPLAVGGQLMIYVPRGTSRSWTATLGLVGPAQSDPDVLLLEPPDRGVFERPTYRGGHRTVGLSQLYIDLLSSPGRGMQEAEQLLDLMTKREHHWRVDLSDVPVHVTVEPDVIDAHGLDDALNAVRILGIGASAGPGIDAGIDAGIEAGISAGIGDVPADTSDRL